MDKSTPKINKCMIGVDYPFLIYDRTSSLKENGNKKFELKYYRSKEIVVKFDQLNSMTSIVYEI